MKYGGEKYEGWWRKVISPCLLQMVCTWPVRFVKWCLSKARDLLFQRVDKQNWSKRIQNHPTSPTAEEEQEWTGRRVGNGRQHRDPHLDFFATIRIKNRQKQVMVVGWAIDELIGPISKFLTHTLSFFVSWTRKTTKRLSRWKGTGEASLWSLCFISKLKRIPELKVFAIDLSRSSDFLPRR